MIRYFIKVVIAIFLTVAGLVNSVLLADDWVLRTKDYSLSRDILDKTLDARGFLPEKLSGKKRDALLQELFIREKLLSKQESIPDGQLLALEKKLADYRKSQIAKLALDTLSEVDMPDFSKRAEELYEVRKHDQYQLPLRLRVRILRQQFNANNKDQIIQSLTHVRQSVVAGETNFKQAVLQNSDDPSKTLTEGDSFWFYQGQRPAAIFEAAENLSDEQALSEVILFKNSAFLLKFIGRQAPTLRSFAEVKDSILAELKTEYRDEQRKLLLSDLRDRFKNEVEIHPDFK